jgi:transposase InsO family protein
MQVRSDPYKRQQHLPQDNRRQQHNKQERHDSQQHTSCKWCGRQPAHQRASCPAKDVTCNNCRKKGHFAKVCQSSAAAGNIKSIFAQPASDAIFEDDTYDALFLNTLSDSSATDAWRADIIVDGKASISFKLDTGADATVIPWSTYQKHLTQPLQPSDKRLFGPNRAPLDIAGMFRATLTWRSASSTQSIYVMRDVQQALLGRPAIDALSILRTVDAISTLDDVKGMFPELFTGLGCMSGSPYKIRLSDSAKPHAIYTPRRVPLALLPQLKAELDKLLRLDVIRKVDEPTAWCAGIVVVPKRSGDIRLCVDLSRLNEAVLREQHTLPDIGQMLASLTGATIFSKLDCNSGFHQVPLDTESALLTTFTTPFGRYCYTRLPFGISSASEHFQKRMSRILEGLEGVMCLIDDILVHGKDKQEHDTRLMLTLQRIKAHGVTLNSKCEFFKSEIKFVGHILSSSGIRPDPDKISAITNMPAPQNVSELRCLLGMVNHLSKFCRSLADISAPLRSLLHKDSVWAWQDVQQDAFNKVKAAISSAPCLALFDPSKLTMVSADASSFGLGSALLQQQPDGTWRPIVYASRALNETEKRYAQVEKECLALTWACERFADFIVGLKIIIQTDHKPLTSLLSPLRALDDIPPRIQRMRIRLMRFNFTVIYVPGSTLKTADALSRFPLSNQPLLIEPSQTIEHHVANIIDSTPLLDNVLQKVRVESARDPTFQLITSFCTGGWPDVNKLPVDAQPYWHSRDSLTYQDGILLCNARIVIPSVMRQATLESLHVGHLGIEKCRAKARMAVWWPKISSDIERFISDCQICNHWSRDRAEPLIPSPLPQLPWQKVATDLFELSGRHYLVIVDYFSRFLELEELPSQTADQVIHVMKKTFARHGIPVTCVSDNGPCYASQQFKAFAESYGFNHITSSPRFPQANGEAESAVRIAKNLLKKANDPHLALLSHRSSPLQHGYSPAQLLMSRQLRSTLPTTTSFLHPQLPDYQALRAADDNIKQHQKVNYDRRHAARTMPSWSMGDNVWITDLHLNATVIKLLPHRSYLLRTSRGTTVRRNGRLLRVPLPPSGRDFLPSPSPDIPCHVRDAATIAAPTAPSAPPQQQQPVPHPPTITRSGRTVKPPDRLDL